MLQQHLWDTQIRLFWMGLGVLWGTMMLTRKLSQLPFLPKTMCEQFPLNAIGNDEIKCIISSMSSIKPPGIYKKLKTRGEITRDRSCFYRFSQRSVKKLYTINSNITCICKRKGKLLILLLNFTWNW